MSSLAVLMLAATACGAPQYERDLSSLYRDAKRSPDEFALHFDRDVARERIDAWRAELAAEPPPDGFERVTEHCHRITWGDTLIDHSYFVYFKVGADGRRVSRIVIDRGGFGQAMAGFGTSRHGNPRETSPYEHCQQTAD